MTPTEKCIKKWEKRLADNKRWMEKYGNSYRYYSDKIELIEETIKDLKRVGKLQKTLTNPRASE